MRTQLLLVSLGLLSAYGQDSTANTTSPANNQTITDKLLKAEAEVAAEAADLACQIYGDYSFFDTSSLRNSTVDYSYLSANSFRTYKFNFCQYVALPCGYDNETHAYAFSYTGTSLASVEGSCQILSGDSTTVHTYDYLLSNTSHTVDRHLVLSHEGG